VKVNEAPSSGLQLDCETAAPFMRRFCRILLWAAGASLCLAALLEYAVIYFPPQILTVDSGNVTADALVVLGGAQQERPERAAELFKQGAAPRILVSGFGDCDTNVRLLEKNGVPANAIAREPHSLSTFENAKFSVPLLRQMNAHRVIIVTSWYHSRRALTCFEHFAPDLQFYSRPSYSGYQPKNSDRRQINNYVRFEYIKLFIYWVCYGVSPWYSN